MKFIGVAGLNGYGVFVDTKALLKAKPHVKEYRVRCFTDVQRAVKWVKNQYNTLQKTEQHQYQIDEITQLYWFYHRRY